MKNTKIISIKNSLLLKSIKLSLKNNENEPPKATLLKKNIVYAAEKTIEEEASTPNIGNLSKVPYKLKNSPTKFNVKGAPQLPKQRII